MFRHFETSLNLIWLPYLLSNLIWKIIPVICETLEKTVFPEPEPTDSSRNSFMNWLFLQFLDIMVPARPPLLNAPVLDTTLWGIARPTSDSHICSSSAEQQIPSPGGGSWSTVSSAPTGRYSSPSIHQLLPLVCLVTSLLLLAVCQLCCLLCCVGGVVKRRGWSYFTR